MLIAQISDFHIVADGRLWRDQIDVNARLEQAVRHLNELDPKPDVVIATGDIVQNGRREEYDVAAAILSGLAMPCFVMPGNHDDRDEMRRAFASGGYLPAEGSLQYNVEDFPLRIIALDTLCPGSDRGELGELRTRWLALKLVEQLERPTVVAMHHPPFLTGIRPLDDIRCFGIEGLAGAITANANVEAILCGHVHRKVSVRWHGALGCVAPATGFQIGLEVREGAPMSWTCEPPACLLHYWTEETGFITHESPIGNFESKPF
jgi:3',5'-cyclic AMP phosphodiesterase CpdA